MSITPLRVGSRGERERHDAPTSERVLSRLIQSLDASASASLRAELLSLSREPDQELLGEGLLSLGGRLERTGQDAKAELVYEAALSLDSVPGASFGPRVQDRLDALRGGGSFGARFEVQARRIFHEASDPALIAGMGAAGLVANGLRLGVLSRLASRPAGCLTRGFGARFSAGAASLAFEAPAFTATVHGANAVLGRPQELSVDGVGRELATGYLLLGALRLSGGAHRSVAQSFATTGTITPAQRWGLSLLEQGGTFGAILASHRAEQSLGLRPAATGEAMAFDGLATFFQFRLGSRLADHAFGPRYQNAMREMQFRSENISSRPIGFRDLLGRATENGRLQPAFAGPELPNILQMASQPPKGIPTPLLPPAPVAGEPSRVARRPPPSQVRTLPTVAETLQQLRSLAPKAQARRLKEIYQNGQLASVALEAEYQAQGSSNAAEFAHARARLQKLESEFDLYYQSEVAKTPAERRWERFQQWQNQLSSNDLGGLNRFHQIARAQGLPDLFTFKSEGINLKARVRRNQETADYYHDLSLVRDFLRGNNLNRVEAFNNDGRLLSNLLLHGDGNCVTLSLLFAHFAARINRPLEIGLLPRHTYLATKSGGAIDSILDYGMVLSNPYLARAIGPESKPLPAQHLLTLHLHNLGKSNIDGGRFDGAESALTLARDLLPSNPRAYLQLGRLHQHRGEAELALQNYRQVHNLHPNDMHRYNSLRVQAWDRIASGEYREAEPTLRKMNDLQQSDMDVLHALKHVFEQTGRARSPEMEHIMAILEFGGD
ncbi:MAG TPA: tetratricopeptide repeat protein [bacterium]|nr:tetratricopeptide repeat protein [bacterium]